MRAYSCKASLPALQLAGTRRLVLGTPGLKLVCNGLLTDLLCLLLVDGLHQDTLVLEVVTLDLRMKHTHWIVGKR